MILSSADILRVLGGSEIVRLSASISIVDGKPPLSGAEGLFVYVNRFPVTEEFEATWTIWVESDGSEPDDLVIAEIKKLLPAVKVTAGLLTTITTTDFRSESTQRAPEAPKQVQAKVDLTQYEERFQELVEDVQDQMLLVTSGRPGRDGRDGANGRDGRNGRDIVATETDLEDLANVEQGIAKENGQVLTWKDGKWQNLFVPQASTISGGGGSGSGGATAINDLTDVDASAPNNNDILVYNSTSGNWQTSAAPPADISGNSIDDLSDVDTSTTAPAPNQALIWNGSEWVPGDVAQDAPVDSVNGQTGVVVLDADDIDDSTTVNKFATAAQLSNADNAVQPGDNVSDLTNDAGYITLAQVPADAVTSVNGQTGDVSLDASDVGAATIAQGALADTATQPGDNISTLTNDAGYITDAGVTQIIAGTNVTIAPAGGTGAVTINATGGGTGDADGGDFGPLPNPDAGDFDAGTSVSTLAYPVDGGNFDLGVTEAFGDSSFNGGEVT